MPSQEDYLDKLLKGIEGSGSADENSAGILDLGDLSGIGDMSDIGILSDLGDLPDLGVMPDLGDLPNIGETPDMGDFFDLDDLPSLEDLPDIGNLLNMDGLSDDGTSSGADGPSGGEALSEPAALGGMSEEDVEQALQANRAEQQNDDMTPEAADEDLMNLLQGTDNSELQDIHDMLQKSDNNEALDEALPAMSQAGSGSDLNAAQDMSGAEDGGEELSERQRKALEKKRLKEEKAAAKKAAKEAKKLAKKSGKSQTDARQDMNGDHGLSGREVGEMQAQSDLNGGGAADVDDSLSVDMSAIDDLLELDDGPGSLEDTGAAGASSGKPSAEKKKGLFARILDFLTEEDEDEEEEQQEKGTENIPLSDENKNILAEMDKEESGKKGKKGKKAKKAKKGKAGAADAENEGEGDEEAGGKKAKKAKKPPKEKKPKEDVPKGPRKKLPVKQLMPVVLTGVTVLFVILLLVNLGGDFTVKRNARQAYYQEDYETCYQELYGRKLNESEKVMFGKSESILRIRLWMREYELFSGEGAEVEALDVLIQSVKDYAQLYEYAVEWNAGEEVSAVYGQMLDILQNQYGLTEAQALEIAAEPDDVEYTRLVTAAAQGQGYHSSQDVSSGPVDLPHMLPEEKQFPENNGGR